MARGQRGSQVIHELLGSTHVFSSTVNEVVEKGLLEEVAGHPLTLSQFTLLKMVALADAQTIGDVALFLRVSNAAASKAVDRLVRRKLLRRVEGRPDRREIHLGLTASSRRLLARYEKRKERRLGELFERYPARVLRRTANLLDRLSAELVDHSTRPEEVCLQCGIYFRDRCLVRQLASRNCFYVHDRGGQRRARRSAASRVSAAARRQKP